MGHRIARIVLGLAMMIAPGRIARAEDEALPAVRTLRCVDQCANIAEPQPLSHSLPYYPDRNDDYYVEGYVRLQYRIDADGHVGDIALLQLVGPQAFADATIRVVKGWTYTPAMLNGKPVPVCHNLLMTFRNPNFTPGARPEVGQAYRNAVSAIKEGKFDEAYTVLTTAQAKPKLNFYERGMLANMSAQVALQKGDYADARQTAALVTDYGLHDLPLEVQRRLWDTRIRASLSMGDIVDAQESLDRLRAVRGFKEEDPIVKLMGDAKAHVDAAPAFALQAKIPAAEEGTGFYFSLYRRAFAFTNITGSLVKFTLSCHQQAVESDISDKAEWHVPKNWSDCHVLVRGAPGTTFQVVQEA